MKLISFLNNRQGFTLIEILAVLVIMGIMASVAISKINDISGTAELRALETGISELNAREMLNWANAKFASGGWSGDDGVGPGAVWPNMDTDIGPEYSWTGAANRTGNSTLNFGSRSIGVTRTPSTNTKAASWAPT